MRKVRFRLARWKGGACGYLTRGLCTDRSRDGRAKGIGRTALRRCRSGAKAWSIDKLNPGSSPIATLTARELTVMVMVSNGYDRQTISERLCLSPKTVSTYRTRIMRKLGTSNDVETYPSVVSARAVGTARTRTRGATQSIDMAVCRFHGWRISLPWAARYSRRGPPHPPSAVETTPPSGSTRSPTFEHSRTIRACIDCTIGSGRVPLRRQGTQPEETCRKLFPTLGAAHTPRPAH